MIVVLCNVLIVYVQFCTLIIGCKIFDERGVAKAKHHKKILQTTNLNAYAINVDFGVHSGTKHNNSYN